MTINVSLDSNENIAIMKKIMKKLMKINVSPPIMPIMKKLMTYKFSFRLASPQGSDQPVKPTPRGRRLEPNGSPPYRLTNNLKPPYLPSLSRSPWGWSLRRCAVAQGALNAL